MGDLENGIYEIVPYGYGTKLRFLRRSGSPRIGEVKITENEIDEECPFCGARLVERVSLYHDARARWSEDIFVYCPRCGYVDEGACRFRELR